MTTFVCGTCGEVVETIGWQVWHLCRGRERELRPVDPVEAASPPVVSVPEGRLF